MKTLNNNTEKKAIKLSATITNFLNYSYRGDGKYYTVEQGSKHYNKTEYAKFQQNNPTLVDVMERGNDAPRGGQTGNYEVVKFTQAFHDLVHDFLSKKEAKRLEEVATKIASQQAEIAKKEAIQDEIKSIAIDEVWNNAKKEACKLVGMEKSDAIILAFKDLLKRNNIEKLQFFYQVMKAI